MTKKILLSVIFLNTLFWSFAVKSELIEALQLPVTDIYGKVITLNDIATSEPIYLKFWATWCQPCMKQMPHLQQTYEKFGNKINVIAVNLDFNDSLEEVLQVKGKFNLTFPIVIDHSAKLAQELNLMATPYHVLLDKNRQIVFKGHKASKDLEQAIKLLAEQDMHNMKELDLKKTEKPLFFNTASSVPSILFFSSAWCDWYLEKSRPEMAKSCVMAQKSVNELFKKFPDYNWSGILTRLWTGDKELQEYKTKFNIAHPVVVDTSNDLFMQYEVKDFPVLIAIKNGRELFRLRDFSNSGEIDVAFNRLSELNSQ